MNVLNQRQIELIHREIDGANTPEESAEARELVATQPQALALLSSLQSLDSLFSEVPDREPPAHLRHAIYRAMPLHSTVSQSAADSQGLTQTITRWAVQTLRIC